MGDYTTIAAVRELQGMADTALFPDSIVSAAIDRVETRVDDYTATSWVHKAFTVTVTGTGAAWLRLTRDDFTRVLYPRTLTSVTVDGTVVADTSGWSLDPLGIIRRDTGVFTFTVPGFNVTVAGTAGRTATAPDDIVHAVEVWARQILLDGISRVERRATSIQNDYGTIGLSQPGRKYPSGIREVDAILTDRSDNHSAVA